MGADARDAFGVVVRGCAAALRSLGARWLRVGRGEVVGGEERLGLQRPGTKAAVEGSSVNTVAKPAGMRRDGGQGEICGPWPAMTSLLS